MASWDEVLKEVQGTNSQVDYIRRRYVKELSEYTGRNTIVYYSSWLNKQGVPDLDINDADMNGFMTCVHGIDCKKGLDLVLHTPGGSPAAAEAIVNYLRTKFDKKIRVIVPQLAMSAGTMIACSAETIIMGKHSSLGPIDPQFNGIPAYNIKSEFEEAKEDLKNNPQNAQYWAIKLQQYPAAFMKTAIDAIDLSDQLVKEWLGTCMFDREKPEDLQIINSIAAKLNEHDDSKIHGRHFNVDFCKQIGLNITMLEDDNILQDKVLSLHHACMITFASTPCIKIIENQNGKSLFTSIPISNR